MDANFDADELGALDAPQRATLLAGLARTWGVERRTVGRALARHLRGGTSKYARAIPAEGIECVALSLCAAFWLSRAWLISVVGIVVLALGRSSDVATTVGEALLALFAALMLVGFLRLGAASSSRTRYRRSNEERGPR